MESVIVATVATGLMFGGKVLWELREGMLGCVNAWRTPKDRHDERLRIYSKFHLIDHPMRSTVLRRVAKGRGVYLFGGPQGCGKSTLLTMAVQSIRATKGDSQRILYFHTSSKKLFIDGNLHKALNIPNHTSVSAHLPRGTVIVVDQFDLTIDELTDDMVGYIRRLACDSFDYSVFHIVIVVSDPAVMKALLHIDMDKVRRVCDPQLLKWGSNEVTDFVIEHFDFWSAYSGYPTAHGELIKLITQAGVPNVIRLVNDVHSDAYEREKLMPMSSTQFFEIAEWIAREKEKEWLLWTGW